MSFGIECYDNLGRVVLSSEKYSPLLLQTYKCPNLTSQGQSGSVSFPAYAGYTLELVSIASSTSRQPSSATATHTLDYAQGFPRLNWAWPADGYQNNPNAFIYGQTVFLTSRSIPTSALTSYGVISYKTGTTEPVVFFDLSNFHFIGKPGVTSYTPGFGGGTYNLANTSLYQVSCVDYPMVFIKASGNLATLYAIENIGTNLYRISIKHSGASPELYCFSKLNTQSSSEYGLQVYKADGNIALSTPNKPLLAEGYVNYVWAGSGWSAGNGSTLAALNAMTPNSTTVLSMTGTLPTNAAVNVSANMSFYSRYFNNFQTQAVNSFGHSAFYRSGNTIVARNIKTSSFAEVTSAGNVWNRTSNTNESYRAYFINTDVYD